MVNKMKKMNNKGFAISTVIYGLSILSIMLIAILMSIMSTNRSNNKQLSRAVEEELNNFSKTATTFSPNVDENNNPKPQEYIIPEDGWYRIELWGAKSGAGANGAYTSGIIRLNRGETLYFYVGKYLTVANTIEHRGRETDVRITSGGYLEKKSYETRIMVAGGGGSDPDAPGGTLYGYTETMRALGGYIDVSGQNKDYNLIENNTKTNNTLIGYPSNYNSSILNKTVLPPSGIEGGGDGYFPGANQFIGGTSFISGYAGCNAIIKNELQNNPKYVYYQSLDGTSYSDISKEYYFIDGMMFPGVNSSDGRAKIEKISTLTAYPRLNTKLNNVRYIKDCITKTNEEAKDQPFKIEVIKDGNNIVNSIVPTSEENNGKICRTIDLGTPTPVDEIAVWHKDGVDYKNHTIEVSDNGISYQYIKGLGINTELSETETVNGIHISAYQFDQTTTLNEAGNYYILPVLSENKVLSAHSTEEDDVNPIKIENINGYKRQKWSIELIKNPNISTSGGEYKIVELSRNKALAIYQDENIDKNRITATTPFNNISRNEPQIWRITPVGNGTYTITTQVPVFDSNTQSGNIFPQTNKDAGDYYNNIIIGKQNINTQRFKLILVN